MIQIRSFEKYYGDKLILSKQELDIDRGIHWVVGENGSGKSTFFKCLAGILPFTGEIKINRTMLTPSSVEYRRMINYTEAEPIYPEFLTGNDMISFVGSSVGASKAQTNELTTALEVDHFKEDKIATYSSGMLKKLSLVLGFMGDPKWMLLDEPFITLDIESQGILSNLILERANTGTGFLISSHQDWPNSSIKFDSVMKISNRTIDRKGG